MAKIAIDCRHIVAHPTAVGICAAELVDQFGSLGVSHDFTLLHNSLKELPDFVTTRYPVMFAEGKSNTIWSNFAVPRLLRELEPDLFHAPFNFEAPIRRVCPTVVTVHDIVPIVRPEQVGWKFRFLASFSYRYILPYADMIIAASEATKRDIVRNYGFAEKIRVVPHGISERFHVVSESAVLGRVRKKYSLPENYVLSVGKLETRKNIPVLIRAFADVVRGNRLARDMSLGLVLAGKPGIGYAAIESAIRKENISDRVKIVNYVDSDDLAAVYTMARAMVFPSLYEGFGLPPLEAMACGSPVICSNTSSLPEVVGDAGLLVSPTDPAGFAESIRRVLTDKQLAQDLIDRGFSQAAKFTVRQAAIKTLEVYDEVLGATKKPDSPDFDNLRAIPDDVPAVPKPGVTAKAPPQ